VASFFGHPVMYGGIVLMFDVPAT